MDYPIEFTDIFTVLVNNMLFPMEVLDVVSTGSQQAVSFCDVYHSQIGFTINIGGNDFAIQNVDYDANVLTVALTPTINVGDTATINRPFPFYGTPIAADVEVGAAKDTMVTTPLIWLRLNYTENGGDIMSTVVRTVKCEIYFLASADHDKELTSDLVGQQIKPMRRLLLNFIQAMRNDTTNFSMDDYSYDNIEIMTKFGIIAQQKGAARDMIGQGLTGLCLKSSIDLVGQQNCLC